MKGKSKEIINLIKDLYSDEQERKKERKFCAIYY